MDSIQYCTYCDYACYSDIHSCNDFVREWVLEQFVLIM